MRSTLDIQRDIERYEQALDGSIDLVTSRTVRASRAWACACKLMQDRIAEFRAELAEMTKAE